MIVTTVVRGVKQKIDDDREDVGVVKRLIEQ